MDIRVRFLGISIPNDLLVNNKNVEVESYATDDFYYQYHVESKEYREAKKMILTETHDTCKVDSNEKLRY